MCLIKLVRLCILSQQRVFHFSCCPREGIRPFREDFIQRTQKQSGSFVLRLFPNMEFLHTKISNKDVYLDNEATEDIPEDACNLSQYRWRFDSIELN